MNKPQTKLEQLKYEFIELYTKGYLLLIGNLYPSIVYKSLMQLKEDYIQEGGPEKELPFVKPPNINGYV